MQSVSPDFAQLKAKMKASWMAGDFGQIANYNVKAGEEFVARTEIKPGCRLAGSSSIIRLVQKRL
jgi:hypothetical protein